MTRKILHLFLTKKQLRTIANGRIIKVKRQGELVVTIGPKLRQEQRKLKLKIKELNSRLRELQKVKC